MLVETFEEVEMDVEGNIESDAEAIAIIESLGLEGQQKLISPDEPETRIPYRKMKEDERFIYELICPKKTKLEAYEDGPIPTRVLQVAAHAKSMFDQLWIWSAADADIKDPVLVGIKGSEWSGERFILARWGAELESLPVLMEQACKLHKDIIVAKLTAIKSEVASVLAAAKETEGTAARQLKNPSFYNN